MKYSSYKVGTDVGVEEHIGFTARQIAAQIYSHHDDGYSWGISGRYIVYGYERSFGFLRAAELCGLCETAYKAMQRKRKWTREQKENAMRVVIARWIQDLPDIQQKANE
jgi:hypothetical protein